VSGEPRSIHERRAWRTDQEWSRLRERIDASEPLPVPVHWWRRSAGWIAVAATLVLAIAGIRWQLAREATRDVRSASTSAGEQLQLRLADSSLITLGPNTTVHFRSTGTRREADVIGLAAFTVVHDGRRPFTVRAKNAVATDLGTKFVIRAYDADTSVEVAVTSGMVRLTSDVRSAPLYLRGGDIGGVSGTGAVAPVRRASVERDTAWIDGRLAFDDEPLSNVADELERWFDVDIRIPDEALAKRRVSAVYNAPSLVGILDALGTTFGARWERRGRSITVVPRTK
jgi:transmembrane sensor